MQKRSIYFSRSEELAKETEDAYNKEIAKRIGEENLIKTYRKVESSVDQMTFTIVKQYKTNPGYSPTVHASWFLAQAYLANLFYTQDHDDAATVAACKELLRVCRLSLHNESFAERMFPVLVSSGLGSNSLMNNYRLSWGFTRCINILQILLHGSHSVCLGFCPVSFVHYLRICVAFRRQDKVENILKLMDERNEHCARLPMQYL